MTKYGWVVAVPALAILALVAAGCGSQAAVAVGEVDAGDPVSVEAITPQRVTLERSTTQPATVHAWYEARVFAKVSGYLSELNVDIGTPVKAGDVLAVIDVPETVRQQEAQQATVKRMEADERRAESQLAVAVAGADAAEARTNQARAEVAQSEATLTAARIEFERVRELVAEKAVADRLLDEATKRHEAAQAGKAAAEAAVTSAEAELTLSRAQIDSARADLDVARAVTEVARRELDEIAERIQFAQLTAPFDGVVSQRHVDPGSLVRNVQTGAGNEGVPLFVVTRIDKVRVRVHLPERDAPLADPNDSARITFQALPGDVFAGRVSLVAGVLAEQTRTMLVEIELPNPDGRLLPGMFGQATIALEPARERITLPANVVRFDEQGKSYVYIVNAADEIEVVDVQTGLDDGNQIEIVDGLSGNERVVGPSLKRFLPGQKIDIK